MVLDPIPQILSVHFFGSRPQPPTSRDSRKRAHDSASCTARVACTRSVSLVWPFVMRELRKRVAEESFARNSSGPHLEAPWKAKWGLLNGNLTKRVSQETIWKAFQMGTWRRWTCCDERVVRERPAHRMRTRVSLMHSCDVCMWACRE